MSKSVGISVEGKATEAGNTKLLRVKYAMLRKVLIFCNDSGKNVKQWSGKSRSFRKTILLPEQLSRREAKQAQPLRKPIWQ